ncbi:MAG: antibiotic biosynthesis monooxygenase family protein [Alphaproteobacteria bacterium]
MYVVIYRWSLKPGREDGFRQAWAEITRVARAQCGSFGSALFRETGGDWIAIARWPDKAAMEACWQKNVVNPEAVAAMNDAIATRFGATELVMDTNLWTPDQ